MKSCIHILAYRLFVLLKLVLCDVSPVLEVLKHLKLEYAGEGGRAGGRAGGREGGREGERVRESLREGGC